MVVEDGIFEPWNWTTGIETLGEFAANSVYEVVPCIVEKMAVPRVARLHYRGQSVLSHPPKENRHESVSQIGVKEIKEGLESEGRTFDKKEVSWDKAPREGNDSASVGSLRVDCDGAGIAPYVRGGNRASDSRTSLGGRGDASLWPSLPSSP